MLAAAILFQLMQRWKLSTILPGGVVFPPLPSFPGNGTCGYIHYALQEGYYWVAEKVLELQFQVHREPDHPKPIPYLDLKETAELVLRFARGFGVQDGEQETWARIAILQTFCEGVQRRGRLADQFDADQSWSFPNVMAQLRELVDQALSSDNSGEWRGSRGFIRQQLIWLDQDITVDPAHTNDAVRSKRYDSLLELWRCARTNNDSIMISSIHWRIRSLDSGQSPTMMDLPFVPYQIYAQH
jgi:hypothetical protein